MVIESSAHAWMHGNVENNIVAIQTMHGWIHIIVYALGYNYNDVLTLSISYYLRGLKVDISQYLRSM